MIRVLLILFAVLCVGCETEDVHTYGKPYGGKSGTLYRDRYINGKFWRTELTEELR